MEHSFENNIPFADNTRPNDNKTVILKLAIIDKGLMEIYKEKVEKHNTGYTNDTYADSGFDLFVPDNVVFDTAHKSKFIDMGVKAEMIIGDNTLPFYIYPRSSISKTPLMLANHTGIIDAGYRGNLISAFRSFEPNYIVEKHTRLVQICAPNLSPLFVKIVDENELWGQWSIRGEGGFGSTGK